MCCFYIGRKGAVIVSFRATILDVLASEEKKKKFTLLLSGGELHPSGGGQPGDSGVLWAENFRFRIDDTEKKMEEWLSRERLKWVSLSQDWKWKERPTWSGTVSSRECTRGSIYFQGLSRKHIRGSGFSRLPWTAPKRRCTWPGTGTWAGICSSRRKRKATGSLRKIVPLKQSCFRRRSRAPSRIKGNWGRIADETIRVVRIPGYDTIACSGSHASSTGEVGNLFITAFRGTAPDWEFKFSVDGVALRQEYSEAARRLVRGIGCRLPQLGQVVIGLQEENGALKKMMERASQYISLPAEDCTAGGLPVSAAVLPGFLRELAAPAAREMVRCPSR